MNLSGQCSDSCRLCSVYGMRLDSASTVQTADGLARESAERTTVQRTEEPHGFVCPERQWTPAREVRLSQLQKMLGCHMRHVDHRQASQALQASHSFMQGLDCSWRWWAFLQLMTRNVWSSLQDSISRVSAHLAAHSECDRSGRSRPWRTASALAPLVSRLQKKQTRMTPVHSKHARPASGRRACGVEALAARAPCRPRHRRRWLRTAGLAFRTWHRQPRR